MIFIFNVIEQQNEDTGSASSLMGCSMTIICIIGMLLIPFNWGGIIPALGVPYVATGMLAQAFRMLISKQPFIRPTPDDTAQDR